VTELNRTGEAARPDDVTSAPSAHDNGAGYHVTRKPIRNEVPNRHIPSTNGRTVGRQATPGRGVPPGGTPVAAGLSAHGEAAGLSGRNEPAGVNALGEPAGRRSAAAAEVTQRLPIPREETVELGHVPAPTAPAPAQRTAPEAPFPSRPAPDDAAAEVWALVERAQAGDADAFGLIYDRYLDTVFRFIYFRVGNRPLAEDLTADTFLRALKRIGSFTWQGRDLGAWLVTIARNLVADHFKSGRYRLEVTTGDVLDADREDRGPEGSPELAVVDHITNVALLSAVRQLNPEQQECIVLRFLQGFSVAETAQAMGKNEGAIKALQYRAVRALHRLLPEGFQP
jgi:RNA polymerase sigma-70 factor (ECF subfamily)